MIGEVVSKTQSGFIPERQLADNIALATALMKGYSRRNISPRCMLKVDLEKAYDSLEWPYPKAVMLALGFPLEFVGWVMSCVTSVSYSILINSFPSKPFLAKKGLRQGDPMSPFLFALAMEYLSRCLGELQMDPNFNFHKKCERLQLTHLMFADDLLMFSRADIGFVQLLFKAFNKFS